MGHCFAKVKQILRFLTCQCNDDGNDHQGQLIELGGGNVHLITTTESWEAKLSEANRDGQLLVVNFSARWCTPCRSIAGTYRELADKHKCIVFVTVDVDELAEFSKSWEITATPTFFFLKDGRQIDKLVGANKSQLQKKIAAVSNPTSKS